MSDVSFTANALSSASAGIISRLLTHPLDTAKARLQAPRQPAYKGTLDVLRRTSKAEGFTALYRGFGAIIVGGTPGTMTYLCSYDYVKNKLTQTEHNTSIPRIPEFAVHFGAGMLAETIACIIYVPVDVIKERLQVQTNIAANGEKHTYIYNGSYDALKKIMRNEGLAGIYKGYLATLASFGPFSAFYFVFYEEMKKLSKEHLNKVDSESSKETTELPFRYNVLCSASAGAAASWITSPLDMAKLRLQIQRGNNASESKLAPKTLNYRNMIDCLSYIYKEGGVKGLFRGAGARVLHFVPSMTITMTCYEEFKSYYSKTF